MAATFCNKSAAPPTKGLHTPCGCARTRTYARTMQKHQGIFKYQVMAAVPCGAYLDWESSLPLQDTSRKGTRLIRPDIALYSLLTDDNLTTFP